MNIRTGKQLVIPILALGLLFLTIGTASAQLTVAADPAEAGFIPDRLARIDKIMYKEMAAGKIPGAVVLVARNGAIAYHKSFGFADIDAQRHMQNDDIFRIASMTKAVTTVAVMMLYEQGRFQLNDPVAKYLPIFKDMRVVIRASENRGITTAPATRPIRIIDLLTHSSGISYRFIASDVQKTYAEAGVNDGMTGKPVTLQENMEILARQPLLFEPGTDVAYGLSTDVLGYLVEKVSGETLDRFYSDNIFKPLAMNDTYFYLPADKADRLVTLYADVAGEGLVVSKGDESAIKMEYPRYPVEGARSYLSGGAGLSSTAGDYARFCQMLLNDGKFGDKRLLSRKSVELMRTARADLDENGVDDFGLGFYVTQLSETGELGSNGAYSWGGAFNTVFWIDPEEKLIGVLMTQVRPVRSNIRKRFETVVYQALQ